MTVYEGPARITIRRLNRYTARLALPPDYLRQHGFDDGDIVRWLPQDDGSVRLEFEKADACPERPMRRKGGKRAKR
ncbi:MULTISPECIES: hypothetical protein [unclassified Bradyrhizobium]|uniref:hypothetical protein n=1 Tax=unclassified Bradyrhizobium TaxID=2631580 RepID=UPI0020B418E6|nr:MULTISPECIES: hypothetical protein [unclassified Bradyrhizobium]MCP3468226.1 hypothetical protein [Bradyrhizobium sp. CCGUVB23]MCP3477685.1 hypothetical protein [Bradyrhizobium sp. CCGUVB1N3]